MKIERAVVVSLLGGIIILGAAFGIQKALESQAAGPAKKGNRPARGVIVSEATLDTLPYQVSVYGQAKALNRIELFAEVSGVLQATSPSFLEGETFKKGQVLLRIEDSEARASLMSQRSNYINTLTQVLPDLKLDYPDLYPAWERYLMNIDVNASTPAPPTVTNPQARILLTARGVISAYHALQSAEERLSKHVITAPFDGVVTQSAIRPGTLVRVGQPLGVFIDPTSFELEATLIQEHMEIVREGDKVQLEAEGISGFVSATVKRINPQVDPSTQSVRVYLEIDSRNSEINVQEGMYLKGSISTIQLNDVVAMPRRLLSVRESEDQNTPVSYIWRVNQADSTVFTQEIKVLGYNDEMALVEGLEANGWYISEVAPGLLEGAKVNVTIQ